MSKIALITGANKGIGFETARQLAASGGVHVVLAARDRAKGVDAALKLQAEGLDVEALTLDVTDAASVAAAVKEIDEQAGKASDRRRNIAAEVPDDLLALYDQIRKSRSVGAAALRAGRCEGCHLSLNTVDLNVIRASAPDEVVRCEECRRILVRTPESGL